MNLQDYLKSINPQPENQHILIYGSQYKCWLQGKYIGVFVWYKDENIGDSFQIKTKQLDGSTECTVATPDKWELII